MRKVILLISATLFFISGCYETDQEIFLNTDGSGKAIVDMKYSPMMTSQFSMYSREVGDSNDMIREMVGEMLTQDNILAWEGLESGTTSEGGLFLKTTSYFENIGDLWGGGNGMFSSGMTNLEIRRTDDGKIVLTEHDYNFEGTDEVKEDTEKPELTDQQVEFKLKQLEMQLQQSKMMMGQYMGDFNYRIKIHLPGIIESASAFTIVDENTVMFEMEGTKIMEEFDKLLGDEAKLLEMVNGGDESMSMMGGDEKSMRRMMLGTDEPMKVVILPDDSLNVDYTKDIETAKANFPEMVEALGIEYVTPIEVQIDPNNVPEVIHAEVIGVTLIYKSATKENEPGFRGRQSYGNREPGYDMQLFVDFSCPVSEIKNIMVESVVDDQGMELVGDDNYSYPEYFSSDKRRVKFDVKLELPSEGASSIKSVQGVITCVSSSKLEKAELGIIELKDNAVTQDGDVKVVYMNRYENYDSEGEYIDAGQVHFEIANHGYKIHDIKLLDEYGLKLNAYPPCNGRIESFGNKTQLTMEFGEAIPEVAVIVVERTKHFAEYELPFELENINLLGKSMEE